MPRRRSPPREIWLIDDDGVRIDEPEKPQDPNIMFIPPDFKDVKADIRVNCRGYPTAKVVRLFKLKSSRTEHAHTDEILGGK